MLLALEGLHECNFILVCNLHPFGVLACMQFLGAYFDCLSFYNIDITHIGLFYILMTIRTLMYVGW